MSTQDKPGKPDLARGWQALEKMGAEDDRAWLENASDEEVEARMKEAGVKVDRTPSADEILARAKERAGAGADAKGKVVPLSRRATPLVVALALAAGFALVVSKAVNPKNDVTASPHEAAATLRSDAFAACAHQRWDDCEKLLNRAKEIEPAGEGDPGVVRARHVLQEMKPGGQK